MALVRILHGLVKGGRERSRDLCRANGDISAELILESSSIDDSQLFKHDFARQVIDHLLNSLRHDLIDSASTVPLHRDGCCIIRLAHSQVSGFLLDGKRYFPLYECFLIFERVRVVQADV